MKCSKITMLMKDDNDNIQIIFEGNDIIIKHSEIGRSIFIDDKTYQKIDAIKKSDPIDKK